MKRREKIGKKLLQNLIRGQKILKISQFDIERRFYSVPNPSLN